MFQSGIIRCLEKDESQRGDCGAEKQAEGA